MTLNNAEVQILLIALKASGDALGKDADSILEEIYDKFAKLPDLLKYEEIIYGVSKVEEEGLPSYI